ncbi:MAG TPA: GNAT family N-acetyltransferase [Bacteroidia bacterium]|nr:GNAT family N-acetyltransferase [Bacteroidia bacterium]
MKRTEDTKHTMESAFELSSGLQLRIFNSISDHDEKSWNEIVPADNFFMQHDFLRTFENASPDNLGFHYAMILEKEKPVAVFCFQVIRITAEEIGHILQPITGEYKAPKITEQWGEWLKRTKKEKGLRILVNGNNFVSGEYGVAIKEGVKKDKIYFALAETVKLITKHDILPAKISSILVKDYFSSGDREVEADTLQKKRYHRFFVEPEMIVEVDPEWKKFDDYLAAMSKKYRNRAKSVMKTSAALTVVEMNERQVEEQKELIHQLYFHLHERAKFKLAALTPEYFVEMKKQFPDEFRIFGYLLDGKLVAFRSSFSTKKHLEGHFIGIDYAFNEDLHLYQRILYDLIGQAIDSGYRKLFLGRTAAEMKTTVGAKPFDLVCYIRHRNGFSNQVIRPFIDYLKPSSWTPRNPFKEE